MRYLYASKESMAYEIYSGAKKILWPFIVVSHGSGVVGVFTDLEFKMKKQIWISQFLNKKNNMNNIFSHSWAATLESDAEILVAKFLKMLPHIVGVVYASEMSKYFHNYM